MKNYFLESCVTTIDTALASQNNGADRLEICSRLDTEGMTPAFELTGSILQKIKIPVRIMIRETENGFEADENTLHKMISSINRFEILPIDGFVFGILKNKKVDREGMDILLKNAAPFPVTFHKAIDLSTDKWDDLEWMNDQEQIDTILSSGGAEHALYGIDELLKTKAIFRNEVMAAGKITNDLISSLHEKLGLNWYHGRNIV